MKKSLTITLSLIFSALIGISFNLIEPLLKDPAFKIINQSQHTVHVTAHWRNEISDLGSIQPSSTYVFTVDDEAAMKFTGHYSDGREFSSEEIYFTGGTVVVATITESDFDVKYDFED